MSDPGHRFERDLVHGFNALLGEEGKAWRRRQHEHTSQLWDVMASRKISFRKGTVPQTIAIEAKSRDLQDKTKKIYWSQGFDNGDQLENFAEFCHRTGIKGFIAVEHRRGRGRSMDAYLIQLERVLHWMKEDGMKGIPMEEEELLSKHNKHRVEKLRRVSDPRQYEIPENFFNNHVRNIQ